MYEEKQETGKGRGKQLLAPQRFGSVLFKLITAFFFLLLPVFIMGLSIYNMGMTQLKGQIRENISTQFHTKISAVEDQLQLAQTQVHQLLNEKNMLRLSGLSEYMTHYDRYMQLNILRDRLDTIHDANDFVRQITVFLSQTGYMVRSLPVDPSDDPFGNWTLKRINDSDFDRAWAASKMFFGKAVYDGALVYPVQQPLLTAIGPNRRPRILVTVEYDTKSIGAYLENMIQDVTNTVSLFTADGQMVFDDTGEVPEDFSIWAFPEDPLNSDVIFEQEENEIYWECIYSSRLGIWFLARISYGSVFSNLQRYRSHVIMLFVLFAAVLLLYGWYSYRAIHRPLKLLSSAFEEVAHGNFDTRVRYDKSNEFGYIAQMFNRMTEELKDSMNKLYTQKILLQQSQIRQLQSQINPHFLYNSMFTLSNMIAIGDSESAEELSRQLGEYFRYITRDARELVPLMEELKHIRSYVEVQRMRFGKRLQITMQEALPGMEKTQVPRMIIQPIVENAFAHALEKAAFGLLSIAFEETDAEYRVIIENSGFHEDDTWIQNMRAQMDNPGQGEITGMINVHRRLKYIFGTGLRLEKKEPDILRVTITIPRNWPPEKESESK